MLLAVERLAHRHARLNELKVAVPLLPAYRVEVLLAALLVALQGEPAKHCMNGFFLDLQGIATDFTYLIVLLFDLLNFCCIILNH